ncbi:MAG: hypothetical protein GX029_06595 [Pseudomonadaceae bacterium]|nr:hypothetical protein [Pseudomonadaceae bacterium]
MSQRSINLTNINLTKILHEAGILLLLSLSLLLLLALFSFNPADSGWNGVTLQVTNNLTGVAGSWLADFLFSLTGVAAWLLVLALAYLATQLFFRPWRQSNWNPFTPSVRCLGFILLMIGLSAVAAGHSFAPHLPYGAGGILGESLATLVKPLLGSWGASLFFIGSFLIGLSLATGWSWLVTMDEIGHFLIEQTEGLVELNQASEINTREIKASDVGINKINTYEIKVNEIKTSEVKNHQVTQDKLYAAALEFVLESRRASVFALQRRFELDYDSAAYLIDRMEQAGLISPLQSNGQRRLLTAFASTH